MANLAQLKALFEKQWESIVGNCDEFLYLGGNEQSTHKYVSELLGKETIDTNTFGKSSGRSGNYSTNYQISGRELLTPDEVRMLDNRYGQSKEPVRVADGLTRKRFADLGAGLCSQCWQDSAGISTSRHIPFSGSLYVPAAPL